MNDDVTAALESVGSLAEPVRRALYDFVVAAAEPVGRDEAAGAVGVSRSLAAFHLDKLVDATLLDASYRRLSGRTGPGAGRPSKLYARGPAEHTVSLPPRRYDLAAELLAQAVESHPDARTAFNAAARRTGEAIAASAGGTDPAHLVEVLDAYGFEPRAEAGRVILANCPFHAIAVTHTQLVCEANLALLEGVAAAAGPKRMRARLDPAEGRCCVVLDSKA